LRPHPKLQSIEQGFGTGEVLGDDGVDRPLFGLRPQLNRLRDRLIQQCGGNRIPRQLVELPWPILVAHKHQDKTAEPAQPTCQATTAPSKPHAPTPIPRPISRPSLFRLFGRAAGSTPT
jgi:hypothetical protein